MRVKSQGVIPRHFEVKYYENTNFRCWIYENCNGITVVAIWHGWKLPRQIVWMRQRVNTKFRTYWIKYFSCVGKQESFTNLSLFLKCGCSTLERQTLNSRRLGSNPRCCRFEARAFSFSPRCPSSPSCINEYPATDCDEDMRVISLCAVTAAWLNVSQRSRVGVGMNRSASVAECFP